MITDKLSAMRAASLACQARSTDTLEGLYDPTTGDPTPRTGGAVATLVRSVIHETFEQEGREQGPHAAMHRADVWLRDMAHEILAVADTLGRQPVAPDTGADA